MDRGGRGRHDRARVAWKESRGRGAVNVEPIAGHARGIDLHPGKRGGVAGVDDPVETPPVLPQAPPRRRAVRIARGPADDHGPQAKPTERARDVVCAATEMSRGLTVRFE